jgi:NAD(P)-dependent dehydrogenase (short-subunit alcohol dehydrogenase family)
MRVDVAFADEVDQWISDAVKEFGKLDGAANVAGLSKRKPDTTSANIV